MSAELTQTKTTTSAIAPLKPSAAFGARGIVINQYDELVRFAQTVASSGLAPKGMEKPESIFVAVQMGLEVGLPPMASLQNISVINGRPAIWGDAQLAVCRGTGEMEVFEEWYEVAGKKTLRNPQTFTDETCAVCKVKRANGQEIESAFSVADAKRANLWGKAGPWTQYPARMLRNRARSFALRDGFGDALKGFKTVEEVQDMPAERATSGRVVAGPDLGAMPKAGDSDRVQGNNGRAAAVPVPATEPAPDAPEAPEPMADSQKTPDAPRSPDEARPDFSLVESTPLDLLRDAMNEASLTVTDIRGVCSRLRLPADFRKLTEMSPDAVKTLLADWDNVLVMLGKEVAP